MSIFFNVREVSSLGVFGKMEFLHIQPVNLYQQQKYANIFPNVTFNTKWRRFVSKFPACRVTFRLWQWQGWWAEERSLNKTLLRAPSRPQPNNPSNCWWVQHDAFKLSINDIKTNLFFAEWRVGQKATMGKQDTRGNYAYINDINYLGFKLLNIHTPLSI